MELIALHVFVSGRVQGVFFRSTAKQLADEFGIIGYAKNLPDGRVELLIQGTKETLDKFLERLKARPGFGAIEHLDISNRELSDLSGGFRIS